MSSVLTQLQAEYEARARAAQAAPVLERAPAQRRKATRTYTGAALARRQAWGRQWGGILSAVSHQLRDED